MKKRPFYSIIAFSIFIQLTAYADAPFNNYSIRNPATGTHATVFFMPNHDQYFVYQGKKSPIYKNIVNINFSPNGKQLAYIASNNCHWKVVDQMSGDPECVAGKMFVVLNGVKQKDYNSIAQINFSGNSEHFYYQAETNCQYNGAKSGCQGENKKSLLILDGQKLDKFNNISALEFSPDSKNYAFITTTANKQSVVLNNKTVEGKDYSWVNHLTFSPNSKHLAFIASRNNKELVIYDGAAGKPYNTVYDLIFSPNSSSYVYQAIDGDQTFVVLNSKEQRHFKRPTQLSYFTISNIHFSPDSENLAYEVLTDYPKNYLPYNDHRLCAAKIILNNKVIADFPACVGYIAQLPLAFSPNSQALAYLGNAECKPISKYNPFIRCKHFVAVNGQQSKLYPDIIDMWFTPDSQYVNYSVVSKLFSKSKPINKRMKINE